MKRQKGIMGLFNKAVVAENAALVSQATDLALQAAERLTREAVADIQRRLVSLEHPDLGQLSALAQRSADLYRPLNAAIAERLQELARDLETEASENVSGDVS